MNDSLNQDPKPQEFKLPTKPIGKAGAPVLAIVPTDIDEAHRISKFLMAAEMMPSHIKKAEQGTVIIMHGLEVGMKPMMAIRRIAIIKGNPTIWGDAVPGLCLATGEVEDWKEWVEGEGENRVWHCMVKRKGIKTPMITQFSVAMAKRANLWDDREKVTRSGRNGEYTVDNDSPWYRYPERMMKMRTRVTFRDLFGDVFNGLYITEELIDRDTVLDESGMRDVTPAKEGWKSVDNPLGDNPKTVEVERKNGKTDRVMAAATADEAIEERMEEAREEMKANAEPATQDHDPETGEVRDREAEEEQENREAAAELAQQPATQATPEKPKEEPKAKEATQAAPEPKNAPAASQSPATTGSAYFQEAMATVANAVDPSKLNQWWRGDRQKRLKECTAAELEQLNAVYGDKFVALAAKE